MVGHTSGALLIFSLCLQLTHAANILAVFSYSFPSPFLLVAPYMKALVQKGHQVTIISARNHLANIDGARHIRVEMLDQLMEDLSNYDFEDFPKNKWQESLMTAEFFYNSSRYILTDAGVQSLIQDKSAHFDMVIVQASLTDALYGFAPYYNASLVGLSVYGTAWNIDYLAGNKAPSVYEPMSPDGYSNGLGLLQKLKNWIYITEEWLLEQLVYLPTQMQLYKRFFNKSADSLYNIRRNFSLMLINQHFSLGRARSNVPNVIEVAGMHLENPSDQLDDDLQRFVDEADHGVIIFSMGMEITGKWLPPDWLLIMQETFAQLPQRVVWKFEQALPSKSKNIYISPMLPQRELLAHPKVKLFITHGGVLSIIEGAYYGVPMLCFPMYYDQFGNAERMKHAGLAQIHDILTMTVESTVNAIKELIKNPVYAQNAQQMSMRLRDQPMSPLDTAVWWTEYVLRHKGAPHMRISEEDMSFMQYYSLDFILVFFVRFGVALLIITCVGLKLLSFLLKSSHMRLTVPLLS
ncbi:UDP-glucuronosyltransferase 2B15-like [Drosophila novamexicana]|uniref:UDP-glucuronosyltransferase 2B15-like n=1 Tax=Drosophila novamexicana TaxID=47314 RepID=UPI0011E58F02|nr:UDP-glucuronosyltransferase 2B15-like [Drosophila novamexicana]